MKKAKQKIKRVKNGLTPEFKKLLKRILKDDAGILDELAKR